MIWLAIDTATDRASIALGGGGEVLAEDTVVGARRHASGLLPAIESALSRVGAGYGDIEGVALADGPGSFTGLRVGAAVTRALLHVRAMPLWVTPSLMVCAAGVRNGGGTVLAVSNALRGELFAAAYRFRSGAVETVLGPVVITPVELQRRIDQPYRLTGPAASTLGGEAAWPVAARLLDLVGMAGGLRLVADPTRWEPEYGRPAEAQAKWERDHGRPLADPAGPAR